MLAAGLAAADAGAAVTRSIALDPTGATIAGVRVEWSEVGRVFLVAAGKAARPMVEAAERALGDRVAAGVGVTVPELAGSTAKTTIHRGGHPVPDPGSLMAARHIGRLLEGTGPRDLVLALISGGASALLERPAGSVPLADLQAATSELLACGATINELNTVRKHLSAVKGGQLARLAAPARVIALVVSDVVGNPLDIIGSGPTVPDTSTFGDAAEVMARYELWSAVPASVADHLRAGAAGRLPETPKAGDPLFQRVLTRVVADNGSAVTAAAARAGELGFTSLVLTSYLEGEAREAARVLAAVAKEVATSDRPAARPACLVAGGETTVTLRRLGGRGGRNQELALAAALALDGWEDVTLAAMGTDGVDGSTEAAGAVIDGRTAARARAAGVDPRDALARHDSGTFFASTDAAIVTGPTGTNVNDLTVVFIRGA